METQKVSAEERLHRLKILEVAASQLLKSHWENHDLVCNLHVAIGFEIDATKRQIDAIKSSIAEGERRCEAFEDMMTWEGGQPDRLMQDGRIWRKPTSKDLGKMVRVSNKLESLPESFPEAKLSYVNKKSFVCEGTKSNSVFWKYAWIECDSAEETEQTDDDGKGYISIQVGAFYPGEPSVPVVKQSLTTEE
jgi:hypothetical protein